MTIEFKRADAAVTAGVSSRPVSSPRRRLWLCSGSAIVLAAATGPGRAHHGWSSFDSDRPLYVEGVVKLVRWQNPHVELQIELKAGLVLPADLAKRTPPAQSQQVDGAGILAKAQVPANPSKTWTLELAPLFRVEAWRIAQPAAGSVVAAVGYAAPGEKNAFMRVEYLIVGNKLYGLRSMPVDS